MPKISVIIPCYNQGQYLDEAVDSVLAQTFQDFEIIIINDGSTDEITNHLLANYQRPKTRVVTTDNQGLPSARNNGIEISSGKYICCLDADDKLHPEYFEKTMLLLDNDAEHKVGFVTTWSQLFDQEDWIWHTGDCNPYRLAAQNQVTEGSLFRKECWEKVHGYATNLSGYQDWNFWISIVSLGYTWKLIAEPLFYYRVRSGSMLSVSNKNKFILYDKIIENNIEFYRSNFKNILLESFNIIDYYDQENKGIKASAEETEKLYRDAQLKIIEIENLYLSLTNTTAFKILKIINKLKESAQKVVKVALNKLFDSHIY